MVETLNSLTDERNVALLLMVIALLIMGTFLDLAPKIIIVTPIFLPVARAYGVEPLHFGVIMVLAGGIGLIMPPIGSVLFVGSAIGKHLDRRSDEIDLAVLLRGHRRAAAGDVHPGALAHASGALALVRDGGRFVREMSRPHARGCQCKKRNADVTRHGHKERRRK